jgi:gamma-glutamyltranspeptidase/glutathione hydrolase
LSADLTTGAHGAVSAGSPQAADVALDVLRTGGTAADAAVAASAVQCVVEGPWCGLGGDAFALLRAPDGTVSALNGTGAAPHGVLDVITPGERMPRHGPTPVAVPALVDAWELLLDAHGTRSLDALLAPAVALAEDGFALDARLAATLATIPGLDDAETLLPLVAGGTAPGDVFRQPDLAATLAAVGREGREEVYSGETGKRIVEHLTRRGGVLRADDLAAHAGQWVEPLSTTYRGHRVSVPGPVSSGVLLLLCLKVVERVHPDGLPAEVDAIDLLVRLKRLVFGTALPRLGDPAGHVNPDLLADDVVDDLCVALARRGSPSPLGPGAIPDGPDTTCLSISAPDGSSISFIHSLFNTFGSRELVPGTGIVLNDRLANLVPGTGLPNALAPGRRPVHTLHAYVVERPDGSSFTGATPGGRGQVQTNLQVLLRAIDGGEDVQSAVTAPRWVHGMPRVSPEDDTTYVEEELAGHADELRRRGHAVTVMPPGDDDHFGSCTVAGSAPTTATHAGHVAGADHRRGSTARAW